MLLSESLQWVFPTYLIENLKSDRFKELVENKGLGRPKSNIVATHIKNSVVFYQLLVYLEDLSKSFWYYCDWFTFFAIGGEMTSQIPKEHIRHSIVLTFVSIITLQMQPKIFSVFIQMNLTVINAKDSFASLDPVISISSTLINQKDQR